MDRLVVVFTMKGCPYCDTFKGLLEQSNIEFYERDIDEYKEEYDMFVEITENEFVPAFMIVESPEVEKPNSYLFAPDRDFNELEEGVDIIKEHLLR
jgi:glutaredoxin